MENLGYKNFYQVLNAKDYGIPQNRERVFVVSILGGGEYEFPQKIPLKISFRDLLDTQNSDDKYSNLNKDKFNMSIEQVKSALNSPYSQERCREIKSDCCSCLLARDWKSPKFYKKSEITEYRKLTPKECWRLMGFNDEAIDKARKVNSDTQLYKQAGNSIVVNILELIFKELLITRESKNERV